MWYKVNWIYVWDTKVRPPVPPIPYLCFTANTAGSTVQLTRYRYPPGQSLETSTDRKNWSSYTVWSTITLSNVGDKVYMRNTSETVKNLNSSSAFHYFVMTWSIAASWDIGYLCCKNSTDTVLQYWFYQLFKDCTALTSCPELPATTLSDNCYEYMFENCSNLETLPKLPATTLTRECYYAMFYYCSKIKVSTTQTWEYQNAYRIPSEWNWTATTYSLDYMFNGTWWTFTWNPYINTTYYTSNTIV